MRRITAKFPGRCRNCRKSISVGDTIYWSRGEKSLCEDCGSSDGNSSSGNEQKAETIEVKNTKLPGGFSREKDLFFTIDWADFKELMKDAAFNQKVSALKDSHNANYVLHNFGREYFSGASDNQIRRWLSEGFQTDAIHGLAEFIPPIREKRRTFFNEDEGELLLDVAWSGADSYFMDWTKRESIPGVAIEASIMFAGSVRAEVVAAYQVWICKTAFSLESAGVDCEITLDFPSKNLFQRTGRGKIAHNIVRVKKENETSDFLSWSPMLSPASLRVFGFSLGAIHADAIGDKVTASFGNGIQDQTAWQVLYDEDRRVIQIRNNYFGGREFPEAKMTDQFREILKKLNSSGG